MSKSITLLAARLTLLPVLATETGLLPNAIFTLTHDLGYGNVSCLNPNSKIVTSNIFCFATESSSLMRKEF